MRIWGELTLPSDRPMRGTFFDVFTKKFSKSLSDCDRRPSLGTFLVTFKKNPGVSVLIVLPLLHKQYSKTVSINTNIDVYFETILSDMTGEHTNRDRERMEYTWFFGTGSFQIEKRIS